MSARLGAISLVVALALAGCSSTRSGGGSVIGFAASSNGPATSIAAAMGSGLIGTAAPGLGKSDLNRAVQAEYRALEYSAAGETVAWNGSGSLRGEVVAYQPYRVGSQDCRQYAHTVYTAAAPQTVRGAACRNADGSWSPLV